ncbi:patatin-like protein 2 [Macadamia integrifolia]|uniref:patatin-like protein 2 n=1 Tax=Macadamia integrifolia TaxID=60698 RepID=UPI001C4EEB5F|nr:patatin-like protein 2 [Macadamia integrifolia]
MIGGIRLDETVTNVVIPTFDMKLLKPTIFTSSQAKRDESMMALLSDVVIGTAAAPTLFPPYSFQITTSEGVTTKFNLYDGGLVAGNPTLVALTETVKEMNGNVDYTKFRVLSLGTGTEEFQGYEADSHCWGKVALKYLLYDPILSTAGERMAEVYAGMLLRTDIYPNNYIRIQIDTLNSTENNMEDPSTENLQNLVEIGEKLLNQTLTRYDPSTGRFLPVSNGVTTRQSLLRFAEELSAEKKRRETKRKLFGAI